VQISIESNLIGANLRGATLSKANLHKADLSGADLFEVNFVGANLDRADLRKVKNLNITQIKQAQNWLLAIYDPEIDLLLKTESIFPDNKQTKIQTK
jgi:uncharacterized protein YjbI with pentapeptide repeats